MASKVTPTQTSSEQYTQGGSSSSSEYGSHTQSHSEGQSYTESHSQGGSEMNSKTAGRQGSTTESQNKSEGGGSATSAGKSWASGTVDDTTLQHRADLGDYVEDQKVQDTYNRLQETIANRPTAFSTNWDAKLNDIYDKLVNGDKFSYDFNKDALYRMYSQQYQQQGKKAAANVLAQASSMTGGYTNSYAQSLSQQQYNEYLKQLNEIIPELQQQAYQRYLQERSDLQNEFNMATQFRNTEYQQYRDTVSDWQSDRSFDQSAYQDMRNYERSNYEADRAYWQQEYWNQRNAEQSNQQEQLSTNWSDSYGLANTEAWNQSETNTSERNWQDTVSQTWWTEDSVSDTSGWENSSSFNWQNTLSNSATWPMGTQISGAGGGTVGGGSSASARTASAANPSDWKDNSSNNGPTSFSTAYSKMEEANRNNLESRLAKMSAPEGASAEQKNQASEKQAMQLINWVKQGSLSLEEALRLANSYGINFNALSGLTSGAGRTGGSSLNLMRTW